MPDIESHILGGKKLIDVHGRWPTFHDAEVIELHLDRGRIDPTNWDKIVLPFLTAKIHVFIENPDSRHTLTTLKFNDVQDFKMEGFNHQNAIMGLSITARERSKPDADENALSSLIVQFRSAFGMEATFSCGDIEVLDAAPCTDKGEC